MLFYQVGSSSSLSGVWLKIKLGLIVMCTLCIASDLAWRTSSYNEWGQRYVSGASHSNLRCPDLADQAAFYAGGLMPGTRNVGLYLFVAANAFLKLYVVVLYMSQSFYGLNGGTHR